MSFSFNKTMYKSTYKQLQSVKVESINTHMQEILDFRVKHLKKSQKSIKVQVNKHCKDVTYKVEDII